MVIAAGTGTAVDGGTEVLTAGKAAAGGVGDLAGTLAGTGNLSGAATAGSAETGESVGAGVARRGEARSFSNVAGADGE